MPFALISTYRVHVADAGWRLYPEICMLILLTSVVTGFIGGELGREEASDEEQADEEQAGEEHVTVSFVTPTVE